MKLPGHLLWPFLLLFNRRTAFGIEHQNEILLVLCLGTAIAVWGYLYLNRAFTIMVEARELKKNGPYRWVRHPVYSGQIICALAVLVWRFSAANLMLVLFFVAIQYSRAVMEEKKLLKNFPEYVIYQKRTGMFLPGFFGDLVHERFKPGELIPALLFFTDERQERDIVIIPPHPL